MVECTGLENRRTLTRTVGSNPTSSAITNNSSKHIQSVTGIEIDLSPKNNLKQPLARLGACRLPVTREFDLMKISVYSRR